MKAAVLRLCTVVVFLLLVIGWAGAGVKNPNALTVAALQGTYDLHTGAMPGDLVGDHGFNMISEIVEITADTLTFTVTFAGMGPFTLTGNTLTVTDSNGNTEDLQATLSDTGNMLTVLDEIHGELKTFVFTRRDGTGTSNEVTEANLQGTYDVDATNTTVKDLVSGELKVTGNIISASLTSSQTGSFTLAGNTIIFPHTDGDTTVLRATLSNDGNTLTLRNRKIGSDTFVYKRR